VKQAEHALKILYEIFLTNYVPQDRADQTQDLFVCCNSCSKAKKPRKALPFLALCLETNYAKMHGGQIFILDIGGIGTDFLKSP
jgi:hypothetical protein